MIWTIEQVYGEGVNSTPNVSIWSDPRELSLAYIG